VDGMDDGAGAEEQQRLEDAVRQQVAGSPRPAKPAPIAAIM
jgi:hypothetical protein